MNWKMIFFLFLGLSFVNPVLAVTEADYYNTGLKFFTAKNYPQAIQYFGAALSLDPHNSPALQGRADSYYELGRYEEALRDYEAVKALKPSDQTVMELGPPDELSQRIQELQAKLSTPSPTPGTSPPVPVDAFTGGTDLLLQKKYASALPYFQQASREHPGDPKTSYYLGVVELMLGEKKEAVLALSHTVLLRPDTSLTAYIDKLKAGLSPADRQWVDARSPQPKNPRSKKPPPPKPEDFGFRLFPAMVLSGSGSFDTNAQSLRNDIALMQSSDTGLSYNGAVPQGALNLGVEPVLKLWDQFELGLPLAYLPLGTAKNTVTDTNGDNYTDSYGISGWSLGLNVRYLIGSGPFQPFLSLGGFLAFLSVDYTNTYDFPGLSSGTVTGSFSALGLGAQAQTGVDWRLWDNLVVSPFAGYQLADTNSLSGKLNNTSGQLETIPTAGGRVIASVSNGTLAAPVFTDAGVLLPGSPVPSGAQSFGMDLSGFKAGLQISAFF
jgi:tetratricopeptide (TPR) repeat protein